MIDLYYWTTPNGHKVTIFLEETDQTPVVTEQSRALLFGQTARTAG